MIIPCSGFSGSFFQCMFFLLALGCQQSPQIFMWDSWHEARNDISEWGVSLQNSFGPILSWAVQLFSNKHSRIAIPLCLACYWHTIARLCGYHTEAVCKDSRKPLIWGQYFLESHSWRTRNLVNIQLPGFCRVCVSVNDLLLVDDYFCVKRFKIIGKVEFFFGWWMLSPCLLYYSCSYLSLWCAIWFVSGNARFTVTRRSAFRIPWCRARVEHAEYVHTWL